jgi:hypothetical protein
MLETGAARRRCKARVEHDQAIRTGAAASVIAHLSLLALLVLLSDVSPLDSATEPIAVNIVTSGEIEPEKLKLAEPPQPALPEPSALAEPALPASAPPPAAAPPQPAGPEAAQPDSRTAAAPPKAQPGSASAGYPRPEPDLSVKYNVVLGLPPELPPLPPPGKSDEGFDETMVAADISSSVLTAFRQHLKSCSKLPESVQPSDRVTVKLRVFLTQDGRLAAEPAIGGGSANVKAIELLQSAIAGLKRCQPYTMLPADRYGEWKVLDLDFTPKDFSG